MDIRLPTKAKFHVRFEREFYRQIQAGFKKKTINPVSISFSKMIKEAISSPWIEKPSE